MRKTAPPQTLDRLLVPDRARAYFEGWEAHPFRAGAAEFDPVNAWWLAEASMLAYADAEFIAEALAKSRLTASGFAVECFARGGTQCFVLNGGGAALVAFRGTQVDDFWATVVDVATDAQFILVSDGAGGRVHKGFLQALGQVWGDLREHLRRVMGASGTPPPVWFTGHSLGGALATLAAERAARELGASVGGLYTLGAPRVGNGGFKARLDALGLGAKTFRVVNDRDVVARVPPGLLYRHVGRLRLIDAGGRLRRTGAESAAAARGPLPRKVLEAFRAAPFFASSLRRFKIPVPKPLADHAPVYYAVHLWNSFQTEEPSLALPRHD